MPVETITLSREHAAKIHEHLPFEPVGKLGEAKAALWDALNAPVSASSIIEVRADEVRVGDELAHDSVCPRWDGIGSIEHPAPDRVAFRRPDGELILACQMMRGDEPRTLIVRRPASSSSGGGEARGPFGTADEAYHRLHDLWRPEAAVSNALDVLDDAEEDEDGAWVVLHALRAAGWDVTLSGEADLTVAEECARYGLIAPSPALLLRHLYANHEAALGAAMASNRILREKLAALSGGGGVPPAPGGIDGKFGRVQTERGTIRDGEPVFILRGQDRATPDAVREYAALCADLGAPAEHVDEVREQAARIARWQAEHGSKVHGTSSAPSSSPADAPRESQHAWEFRPASTFGRGGEHCKWCDVARCGDSAHRHSGRCEVYEGHRAKAPCPSAPPPQADGDAPPAPPILNNADRRAGAVDGRAGDKSSPAPINQEAGVLAGESADALLCMAVALVRGSGTQLETLLDLAIRAMDREASAVGEGGEREGPADADVAHLFREVIGYHRTGLSAEQVRRMREYAGRLEARNV